MRTSKSRHFGNLWPAFRTSIGVVLAMLVAVTPVQGAFHLWNIREVYTDASGTKQFIELFTSASGQTFVGGQQIRVSDGVTTHTFTISGNLASDSANHALLFGTASITNFGSPKPNYVLPDNFVFANGGTISFFGANSGAYTALPADGVLSRTWSDGNAINSPQNFGGESGTISIPNSPPNISITNPPDNSLFAAPANVTVGLSASDSDGSVANVQLLTNGVAAATNTVAPFGFTLFSLAAGNYILQAIAQDNGSLNATSAPVTIRLVDRPGLIVSPGLAGPLRFQFSTIAGIAYIVERATLLTNFSPVVTNPGTGGVLQFEETDASAGQRSYRVRLE